MEIELYKISSWLCRQGGDGSFHITLPWPQHWKLHADLTGGKRPYATRIILPIHGGGGITVDSDRRNHEL